MQLLVRLNPNHIHFDGAGGGIPELTTADISAALAGANKAGLDLLIGQVCGGANFKALYETFYPEAIKVAKMLKWRLRASDLARTGKLLEVVLIDSLISEKCPSCKGTQHSKLNPADSCPTCYGTGRPLHFDFLKARYLGVNERNWRKTWREREKDMQALLDRRIYQAKNRIRLNLYGESLT